VAQSLVGLEAGIRIFRDVDRLPGVSGAQVMARTPQFIEEYAE